MDDMDVGRNGDSRAHEERDDRRGGGRYRGHDNRKRRRDDDEDFQNDRRGPQQRRRRDDGPPRRRFEEDPLAKLRRMLLNIASSTKLPQDEATEIAKDLGTNYDDERVRTEFFDIFIKLLIEQPFKIPFVSAVAFYANDVNPTIAAEAMKLVGAKAQEALNAGRWKEFKLLLRFLACLQPLYEGDGIFALLSQLFDTVVDLQSANENDMVGIEIVKVILLTIPYALVAGGSQYQDQAQELLKNTAIVAGNVVPMESLIHSYSAESEDKPISYSSVIALLQIQLTNEAENNWNFACIPRFDQNALRRPNGEESMPTVPEKHDFPTITIPSPVNPGANPLFPEPYFSLYSQQDIETVPKTTNVACSLLRDAIVDTIDQLDFNRDISAKFLVEVDCYFTENTFAKRGVPYDKFKDVVGDDIKWKSEDMIVDAIFSQLFKLPNAEHKLVYYHSLITQCCKIAPAAIAPSLGRAIRAIYKHLDILDLELANRFLDWFSHHLSNFEFRWRWTEWLEDLALSNLHPKKAFIIATLDREIRLSFAKRIRSTVPEEMHSLIPERLDEDHSPDFKYDNPQTPYSEEGKTLLQQLRKKASNDEIQATINKIHEQAIEHGISDVLVPSTDAFVTAICRHGAKTLSHILSCIERTKDRFHSIAQESDAARRQIVASVIEYWSDSPGVAVKIITFFLNYQVITPMTVVEWALGDYLGAGEALTKSWVFEMVSNTVDKVASRNRQIAQARLQKGLPQEQIDMVEATLATDRDAARNMFKYIDDSMKSVADGTSDTLLEMQDRRKITDEEAQLIRSWGQRWRTAFLRKAQVEESVVGEEAMVAKIRLLAAEPDPEPEAMQEDGNGVAAANGADDDAL